MSWIRIAGDTMLNSEKIGAIVVKKLKHGTNITFFVDGKSYISDLDPHEIMRDVISAGINLNDQFFRG